MAVLELKTNSVEFKGDVLIAQVSLYARSEPVVVGTIDGVDRITYPRVLIKTDSFTGDAGLGVKSQTKANLQQFYDNLPADKKDDVTGICIEQST